MFGSQSHQGERQPSSFPPKRLRHVFVWHICARLFWFPALLFEQSWWSSMEWWRCLTPSPPLTGGRAGSERVWNWAGLDDGYCWCLFFFPLCLVLSVCSIWRSVLIRLLFVGCRDRRLSASFGLITQGALLCSHLGPVLVFLGLDSRSSPVPASLAVRCKCCELTAPSRSVW